ncbi:hypothetical protein LCGC14_0420280 [marine sediment metagenome]|uniref:Uncharacterized protein n=1 Tax=marine sediment metagenome TaxID=412755 RepID=A0A0F9SX26_9ZZZZ
MRLTKKKAIDISKEKWADLAETGDTNEGWDWHQRHGYEPILNDCALCEYDQRPGERRCSACPYWQRFSYCGERSTPYYNWSDTPYSEDRKKYANAFFNQLEEL